MSVDEIVARQAEEQPAVAVTAIMVKAEAQRRIFARYPQWRQANMTARGVKLLRKGEPNWTAAEQAEAVALDVAWLWIMSVRAASDALEAMVPIPVDYIADSYWPAM
jgi:hypothetical protein